MPAIHLPRLKKQVAELVQAYADPALFERKLRDVFAFYGDRTRRISEKSPQTTGLPSVNLPQPVIKEIVTQLTPYAHTAPHTVLALARTLWAFPQLEYRQLAAQLLGRIPAEDADEVLPLVTTWCQQNYEEAVLINLATHSMSTLRQKNPPLLLDQIQIWLYPEQAGDAKEKETEDGTAEEETEAKIKEESAEVPAPPSERLAVLNLKKLALTALPPLIQNPQFENLPRIYTIIDPILQDAPKVLRPYILDVLHLLAVRVPQELAFILQKHLSDQPSNHLKWLARRAYPRLPEEFHTGLYPLIFSKGDE